MTVPELRDLIESGTFDQAARMADALLNQWPQDPALWEMRAYIALNLGDGDAAVRSLERAVELQPQTLRWLAALGGTLATLGRLAEAETVLHRAYRMAPQDHALMLKLAQTLHALRKPDEAAMLVRRLVSLDPVQPAAWRLLGQIALAKPDPAAALRALERAGAQAPDVARVQFELGQACVLTGDLRRAHGALERSLQLDPRLHPALIELLRIKQLLADWDGMPEVVQALQELLRLGLPGLPPLLPQVLLAATGDAELQRAAAMLAANVQVREVAGQPRPLLRTAPHHGSTVALRIGVLADNFDDHAGTRGMVEVIERLRIQPVELTLFASGRSSGGALRKRLQAVWPLVELADWPLARAAQRIADAGLHVLLDASGGDGQVRNRLPILRPCALQLAWPGIPATAAAPWIDGIIGDAVLLDVAHGYPALAESALLLDCCAVGLDTRIQPVSGLDRAAAGLPPRGFVFAHLGGPRYYHPRLFDAWARILQRSEHSVLLLAGGLPVADCAAALRDEMLLRGLAATRIVFCGEDAPDLHLARLAHVDLVLDSWPFSAREQAGLAALAGVPVLTLPGAVPASRLAASLNAWQQLADLNCASEQQYIDTAVAIAANPAASEVLRETLQSRRGPGSVLDMQHTAKALYTLLRERVG